MGGFYGFQGYKIECEFQFLINDDRKTWIFRSFCFTGKRKIRYTFPIEKGWRNMYGRKNGRTDRRDFKRTSVSMSEYPVPSRLIFSLISVSFVFLSTEASRAIIKSSLFFLFILILEADCNGICMCSKLFRSCELNNIFMDITQCCL